MIQLTPEWLALEAKCTTPFLVDRYKSYTLQILNGYIGQGLACYYLEEHIKKQQS